MLLYFIRHGQTDWNKDMRMQGQSDIPLNENGRESAIEAGKTLANTHIDPVSYTHLTLPTKLEV